MGHVVTIGSIPMGLKNTGTRQLSSPLLTTPVPLRPAAAVGVCYRRVLRPCSHVLGPTVSPVCGAQTSSRAIFVCTVRTPATRPVLQSPHAWNP